MDHEYWTKYWNARWERDETGWHQTEVEPLLIANFSNLQPTRVLVPLCGKSLDLRWLRDRGHEVLGVEINEGACRSFFTENGIYFSVERRGHFNVYSGANVTIFNGDIFYIGADEVKQFGAIYDRAALIALNPDLRARYAKHMTDLVRTRAHAEPFMMLQIVLEKMPHDHEGPPFSVPEQELNALYGAAFEIKPLSRNQVDMHDSGFSKTMECAYNICTRTTKK